MWRPGRGSRCGPWRRSGSTRRSPASPRPGRALERGGTAIQDAGGRVGSSLDGVPLIGQGVGDIARSAFSGAGEPFVFVGGEFVDLITLIAAGPRAARPGRRDRPVAEPLPAVACGPPRRAPGGDDGDPDPARRGAHAIRSSDSSPAARSTGCPGRRCSITAATRSATSPPAATGTSPGPSSSQSASGRARAARSTVR